MAAVCVTPARFNEMLTEVKDAAAHLTQAGRDDCKSAVLPQQRESEPPDESGR